MTKRLAVFVAILFVASSAWAQEPVDYRLSFPAPEHRWMQVDVRFTGVPVGPLELRMARTSPGRYALTEAAKNVYDVQVTDAQGRPLTVARPNLHQWDVTGHTGTVVVHYKIFGDRTDGTYLGIDSMHAHINMPAAMMWARGWLDRPARVTFVRPAGKTWKVATQLFPTNDPLVFTAPNIQYLMDSPTEFSDFTLRTFTVDDGSGLPAQTFRVALLHDGTEAEADAYARDIEKTVRESIHVFGELPRYDAGTYTFIAVYLPWASGDGMEHRNSTSLTGRSALRSPAQRDGMLGTVSHEFFHNWNMERIRSKGIEPFDFEHADMSDDLWLGEGFTNYYDDLILHRAGLQSLDDLLGDLSGLINQTMLAPGRKFRNAVDMSRLAPFVDAAVSVDRTNWSNLFLSYYTYGSAIGLALDLELRGRTGGKVTGDTFMQALWQTYGKPGVKVPGYVATPYTTNDVRETLAKVSGDRQFAQDFFARYVEGHELADYPKLLARAGLVARVRNAGKAWLGNARLQPGGGSALQVAAPVPFDSPLYNAGVEFEDQVVSLDGVSVASQEVLEGVLAKHKAGDSVPIRFTRRSGESVNATLTFGEDPRLEILPIEKTGGTLTADQKAFRDAWLNSQGK